MQYSAARFKFFVVGSIILLAKTRTTPEIVTFMVMAAGNQGSGRANGVVFRELGFIVVI